MFVNLINTEIANFKHLSAKKILKILNFVCISTKHELHIRQMCVKVS